MSVNTVSVLSAVEYGVPSGNYDGSSQDFVSDAVPAADFYHGRGGLQTALIRVTAFSGQIILEGSLDTHTESAKWFSVYEYGDSSSATVITDYHPVSLTGNFVWFRARVVAFDAGTIDFVNLTY